MANIRQQRLGVLDVSRAAAQVTLRRSGGGSRNDAMPWGAWRGFGQASLVSLPLGKRAGRSWFIALALLGVTISACSADDPTAGSATSEAGAGLESADSQEDSTTTAPPATPTSEPDPGATDPSIGGPAADVPDGFVLHGGPELGFSVAVPDSYSPAEDFTYEDTPVGDLSGEIVPVFVAIDYENPTAEFIPSFSVFTYERGPLDEIDISLEGLSQSQPGSDDIEPDSVQQIDHSTGPAVVFDAITRDGTFEVLTSQLIIFAEESI